VCRASVNKGGSVLVLLHGGTESGEVAGMDGHRSAEWRCPGVSMTASMHVHSLSAPSLGVIGGS